MKCVRCKIKEETCQFVVIFINNMSIASKAYNVSLFIQFLL